MSDLNKLKLAEARDALRKGDVTSVELTEACLSAIEGADALGAYVHKTPEIALDMAKAADARIKAGDAPDLCGLPLGIKDLFCTKGVNSQAASGILNGFKPEYESTVTTKLFDAGAVMTGKLNMDEFAMGSSNETSHYGAVTNPWKREVSATATELHWFPAVLPVVLQPPWPRIFALARQLLTQAVPSVSLLPLRVLWV